MVNGFIFIKIAVAWLTLIRPFRAGASGGSIWAKKMEAAGFTAGRSRGCRHGR